MQIANRQHTELGDSRPVRAIIRLASYVGAAAIVAGLLIAPSVARAAETGLVHSASVPSAGARDSQPPVIPHVPSPSNSATSVPIEPELEWDGGAATVDSVTLDAVNRGWWREDGFHDADNNNTFTGFHGYFVLHYNSYFVFDVDTTGAPMLATLRLEFVDYSGTDPSEALTVYDVTTDAATLEASGNNVAIFEDLQTGNSYGNFTVTRWDEGTVFEIPLNAQGINDIAAAGDFFSIGLHVDDIGQSSSTEGVRFSDTYEPREHQLVLVNTAYDVYFGTDNPPTALLCADTAAATCHPGALSYETTYYWQVIAKNAAGDAAGPVWSFTTAPCIACEPPLATAAPDPADWAMNVPVHANLGWTDNTAIGGMVTLDAVNRGRWSEDGFHSSADDSTIAGRISRDLHNSYFIFDLSTTGAVSMATLRLEIENYFGADASEPLVIYDVHTDDETLEGSGFNSAIYEDLQTGNAYGTFDVALADVGTVVNTPLNAQALADVAASSGYFSVGVHADAISAGTQSEGVRFSYYDEPRVHQLVVEECPRCPTTYDVYLGMDDPPTTLVCADTDSTVCDPGLIECETRYYWRVVAKTAAGETAGPVWSFWTEGCPCEPPPAPTDPAPADNATDVFTNAELRWNSSTQRNTDVVDCLGRKNELGGSVLDPDGLRTPQDMFSVDPNCFAFGGSTESYPGAPRLRSEIITVNWPRTLTEIRMELSFTGTRDLYFYVFQADTLRGPYSLVEELVVATTGVGRAFCSSGPIGVPLDPGVHYGVGAAWGAGEEITYYRAPASFPTSWEWGTVEGLLWSNGEPPYTSPLTTVSTVDGAYSVEMCFGPSQDCATTYDVMLDTYDPPTTPICADASTPTCDPGPLSCEADYYWQVVARTPAGETTGPVWSFAVEHCPYDLEYQIVLRPGPSAADVGELPASVSSVRSGQEYYVELWARDRGSINTGLSCVYADLLYDASMSSVVGIEHCGAFTQFGASGEDDGAGRIDELGGCTFTGGLGVEPDWACVARVEMEAAAFDCNPICSEVSLSLALEPASSESSAYGRGAVLPEDINHVASGGMLERTCVYNVGSAGGDVCFVNAVDVGVLAPSWLSCDGDDAFDANLDFDCSGCVAGGDIGFFATAWMRYCDDPNVVFPACRTCALGANRPTAPGDQNPVQFAVRLSRSVDGPDIVTGNLPAGESSVASGETVFAELWVRDPNNDSQGVVAAYADWAFQPEQFDVISLQSGAVYAMLVSGHLSGSAVTQAGGASLVEGLAVNVWVRVISVELVATSDVQRPIIEVYPASIDAVARYGDGALATNQVQLANPFTAFWWPDADGDGDVDLDDFSAFVDCLGGPSGSLPMGCLFLDANGSGHVDLADFAKLQSVLAD